jgi:hypothetical protein
MTEAEWLAAADVSSMVQHLGDGNGTERKFRLFALECVRAIRNHLRDERSLAALEFVEANGEKLIGKPVAVSLRRHRRQVEQAASAAHRAAVTAEQANWPDVNCHPDVVYQAIINVNAAFGAYWLLADPPSIAARICAECAEEAIARASVLGDQPGVECTKQRDAYERQRWLNIASFRDIFGNPFRPVAFDAAWRSDAAVSLAKAMYESRDFGNMPILADALQDAGCDRDDVLNHCRDANGVHVRGCWVVDLVLGKQ